MYKILSTFKILGSLLDYLKYTSTRFIKIQSLYIHRSSVQGYEIKNTHHHSEN